MDPRPDLIAHLRWLQELGVPGVSRDRRWRARPAEQEEAAGLEWRGASAPRDAHPATTPGPPVADDSAVAAERQGHQRSSSGSRPRPDGAGLLAVVREDLGDCRRCKLHRLGRRQIVFGVGNPSARLMFVGEAPGHDEDVQGIPFVGRAGQLLTRIIESIGLKRDEVYIANVIKCRPPENRNPERDEVESCEPFLFRQVETIRPKVIVALGKFAAQALLKSEDPISRLRGRVYTYGGARLVATFHPAYLLRSPERKRETWEDMKKVRALLAEEAG